MQLIFLIVALSGAGYFLFANRRFDLLSVGYASAFVYFFPGFTGEVVYPMEQSYVIGFPVAIHPETYLVMSLVLIAIVAAAIVFDLSDGSRTPNWTVNIKPSFSYYAIGYTYLGVVATWITVGTEVMTSPDKNLILEEFTRWSILWSTGSTIAFVLACEQRRAWLVLFAAIPLAIEIYAGFRSSTALAFISVACLWLNRQGNARLIFEQWRVLLFGVASAMFLFVYKLLFAAVKAGEWEIVAELLASPELYINALWNSEPFLTQSILNEVLREDFRVGWGYLVNIPYAFLLFAPELGLQIDSFNEKVQTNLFPNIVESGVAANIWAEMYSAGGWVLLAGFIIAFAISLAFGSYLIRGQNSPIRAIVAAAFCVLAFYIHRNELQFQITLEKRMALFLILCWASAALTERYRDTIRKRGGYLDATHLSPSSPGHLRDGLGAR